MTDTPTPVREEFDRLVHEALNHLYDSPALEKLPLLDWLVSQEQVTGSRSQHLRRMLLNTIQSFKPDRAVPLQSPDWRGYQILEQRFITGMSPNEVITRLNISRSLFFMEQARMIKRLADALWEKSRASSPAQVTRPEPPDAAVPTTEHEPAPQSTEALLAKAVYKPVSIQPLLNSLQPVAQSLTHAHRVKLEIEPFSSDRSIPQADRVLLRQVIISLIAELVTLVPAGKISLGIFERAAQHSGAQSCAAQYGILIRAQAGSADTNLTVLEDRQGLSPEVCRELVVAMGGDLNVQMVSETEYVAELAWRADNVQRKILLIDDQPDLGDLFRRYLEGTNWKVVQASGAQDARIVLAASPPNVILLDVIMPQEDGWEFLVEIKGSSANRSIPVVVCSAVNEPELVRLLGADGYLPKPIMQADLLKMLKKIT